MTPSSGGHSQVSTLSAEVPGHRQEQVTQTLIKRLLKRHLFCCTKTLGPEKMLRKIALPETSWAKTTSVHVEGGKASVSPLSRYCAVTGTTTIAIKTSDVAI